MTKEREALKLALEALENIVSAVDTPYRLLKPYHSEIDSVRKLIPAIKKALAQPEQEPVAKYSDIVSDGGLDPRNTTPPQRTWVGLTDEEREKVYSDWRWSEGRTSNLALCKDIEAKLKEKNP